MSIDRQKEAAADATEVCSGKHHLRAEEKLASAAQSEEVGGGVFVVSRKGGVAPKP